MLTTTRDSREAMVGGMLGLGFRGFAKALMTSLLVDCSLLHGYSGSD